MTKIIKVTSPPCDLEGITEMEFGHLAPGRQFREQKDFVIISGTSGDE